MSVHGTYMYRRAAQGDGDLLVTGYRLCQTQNFKF